MEKIFFIKFYLIVVVFILEKMEIRYLELENFFEGIVVIETNKFFTVYFLVCLFVLFKESRYLDKNRLLKWRFSVVGKLWFYVERYCVIVFRMDFGNNYYKFKYCS